MPIKINMPRQPSRFYEMTVKDESGHVGTSGISQTTWPISNIKATGSVHLLGSDCMLSYRRHKPGVDLHQDKIESEVISITS